MMTDSYALILDTQGMTLSKSPKSNPNYATKLHPSTYEPFTPKVINAFNAKEKQELKEIFREVLDEYRREKAIQTYSESTEMHDT